MSVFRATLGTWKVQDEPACHVPTLISTPRPDPSFGARLELRQAKERFEIYLAAFSQTPLPVSLRTAAPNTGIARPAASPLYF